VKGRLVAGSNSKSESKAKDRVGDGADGRDVGAEESGVINLGISIVLTVKGKGACRSMFGVVAKLAILYAFAMERSYSR